MSEISKSEQSLIIKKIDNNTVNISINDNEMLMAIVGQFDQNLKSLSKLTRTDIYFRGNSITCKGDDKKLAIFCDALKFLINKYFLTIIIFILSLFILTSLLSLSGIEFENSFKLSILTLMNTVNSSIYGLSEFNFNNLHFFTKYTLIFFMIIGRIELLTVLLLIKKFLFKN